MSDKIETVFDTVTANVDMLKHVIRDVDYIHNSMNEIKSSANEIDQAMESSSSDAEILSHMTLNIHDEATQSVAFSKRISKIDDDLSTIVRNMFNKLQCGRYSTTGQDLQNIITKAKVIHSNWLGDLDKMVVKMRIYPLQTDAKKCAFGHFYQSIAVDHPKITDDWQKIDGLHHKFHNLGNQVISSIKINDKDGATRYRNEANNISVQLMSLLDQIHSKLNSVPQVVVLRCD